MGEGNLSAANVARSLIGKGSRKASRRGSRDGRDRCISFELNYKIHQGNRVLTGDSNGSKRDC